MDQVLTGLLNWYLNSAIYVKGNGYRENYTDKKKSSVYPEITAYSISLSKILYQRTKKDIFKKRAIESANYLIELSKEKGIIDLKTKREYSFDTGIFISALFDLYEITKDKKYLSVAKDKLNYLNKFFDGEKFYSVEEENNESQDSWDLKSSVHLVKLAIPLIKGFTAFDSDGYKDLAETILDWGMKFQEETGRFRLNESQSETMIHPHCYATEGYAYSNYFLKKSKYNNVIDKSIKWLSDIQNSDGSFYRCHPYSINRGKVIDLVKSKVYREKITDGVAQAVRLWKIFGLYNKKIEKAEKYLENNLVNDGLLLITRKYPLFEIRNKNVYSWPTFFYIHSKLMEFGDKDHAKDIF